MLTEETRRKQGDLKKLLLSMAGSCFDETAIRQTAIKLKGLYEGGFRHSYSEFFPLIVEISRDDNSYSVDYLSNNLEALQTLVEQDFTTETKQFESLYEPLSKLSDHINLEIGRFSHYSVSEQHVADLEAKNTELRSEIERATNELLDAKEKISTVQTELIAVLSIFAAIVLAFSGSSSYFSSALSGMRDTNFFKMVAIVLLCGFCIFNLIFAMMYVVGKITRRNIYAKCQNEDCICKENGKDKCSTLRRIRKRLPYVFWFNVAVLILLTLDIVAWCLNMNVWYLPF